MKTEHMDRLVALLETAADNARKARDDESPRDLMICFRGVTLAAELLLELDPEGAFVKHLREQLRSKLSLS